MIDFNNISFENEHELYETIGFLCKEDCPIVILRENNQRSGAYAAQNRFVWNRSLDLELLPVALSNALKKSNEQRISVTGFVDKLINEYSFDRSDNPGGYSQHYTKTSIDDVIKCIPEENYNDFYRGLQWGETLTERIKNIRTVNEENFTNQKYDKDGKKKGYYTTRYERNPRTRKKAIELQGCKCQICGFDFEECYGELGKEFIEVHHIKPLSTLDEEIEINPETDLICVCANCHRMLHRFDDYVLAVDELKEIIKWHK